MIRDLGIMEMRKIQTFSFIGIQGACECMFASSCGKLVYGMVIYFKGGHKKLYF